MAAPGSMGCLLRPAGLPAGRGSCWLSMVGTASVTGSGGAWNPLRIPATMEVGSGRLALVGCGCLIGTGLGAIGAAAVVGDPFRGRRVRLGPSWAASSGPTLLIACSRLSVPPRKGCRDGSGPSTIWDWAPGGASSAFTSGDATAPRMGPKGPVPR